SSRRRHTSFSRDWSSDVCSSDLAETYVGGNGYSLRMDGLEPGFNDRARERLIVMHGADYVDPRQALQQGRLGRSFGCPAVRGEKIGRAACRERGCVSAVGGAETR